MRRNRHLFWGVLLIIAIVFTACSPSAAETPQQNQDGGQPTTAPDQPQPIATEEEETGSTETQALTGETGARGDIPIMEGARGVQIMRGGATITYEVDTDIDTVVEFYQQELPGHGWEMAGPPDSALASIATMLRENDSGDRMTINLQENQLGGFVKVNISVVRAN